MSGKRRASASEAYAAGALKLRRRAQDLYAQGALEELHRLGTKASSEAVRVSALRELLEQTLGRPPNLPAEPPAAEDPNAALAAFAREVHEKLDREIEAASAQTDSDGME